MSPFSAWGGIFDLTLNRIEHFETGSIAIDFFRFIVYLFM